MEVLQLFAYFGGAVSPVAVWLSFWLVSLKLQESKDGQAAINQTLQQHHERLNRLESRYFEGGFKP